MKVTIIGAAGSVGSPTSFHIADSGLADEIVMIDVRRNVLQHHAMDLGTAVSGLDVRVKAGEFEDLAGSDVVINAAGVHQDFITDRMEMFYKNLPVVRDIARQVKRYSPDAFVITVTNPVDHMNYATWRAGGLDRHQVVGYSINDSLRFRELVARVKGVKVSQVEATVIGEHGRTQVLVFSSVRIDGRPVSFSEEEKEDIHARAAVILKSYQELLAGRTAGWSCAIGLTALTRAVLQDTGEIFPCSTVLDGEYGQSGLSMAVPVVLGGRGVQGIVEWELAPDEQAGVERTARALKPDAKVVDESL